ncbi:hypothetical protein JXQ70_13510 [bacterium]|nr:hypothetical protein [bacterium]
MTCIENERITRKGETSVLVGAPGKIRRLWVMSLLGLCWLGTVCGLFSCSGTEQQNSGSYTLSDPMVQEFCVSTVEELQDALDIAAGNGYPDIIKLVQGTYKGRFRYEETDEPYGLIIEGGYDQDCLNQELDPSNTIIDAQLYCLPLILESFSKANLTVRGLTFQNGHDTSGYSGGLRLWGGTISIIQCRFVDNYSGIYAGGIFIPKGTSISIIDCYFANNTTAAYGGAVLLSYCDELEMVTLAGNVMIDNRSGLGGHNLMINTVYSECTYIITGNTFLESQAEVDPNGYGSICLKNNNADGRLVFDHNVISGQSGVYIDRFSEVVISHNLFTDNSNTRGGGLFCHCGELFHMINNTFSRNYATNSGGAVFLKFMIYGGRADIYNNIFWSNQAGQHGHDLFLQQNDQDGNSLGIELNIGYNDLDFGPEGVFMTVPYEIDSTNMDRVDPCFVDPDSGSSPDFHLQSRVGSYHNGAWSSDALDSPCIDAGSPDPPYAEYANEPRPNGSRVNMGCYGNTDQASRSHS